MKPTTKLDKAVVGIEEVPQLYREAPHQLMVINLGPAVIEVLRVHAHFLV